MLMRFHLGESSWEDMKWGWGDRIHPGYPKGRSIAQLLEPPAFLGKLRKKQTQALSFPWHRPPGV